MTRTKSKTRGRSEDRQYRSKEAVDAAASTGDVPDDLPAGLSQQTIRNFPLSVVLSDPRVEDTPIVFVNEAFTETTGYSAKVAVGRNCRFLQGEKTDPNAVRAIREALADEREITIDILNYRADGEEFVNRLMIAPLRDEDTGVLAYFLGIQTQRSDYTSFSERNAELDERLRELQHRVKNHLTLVIAMIRLEANRVGNGDDPQATFEVLSRRVETLSLLYQQFADAARDGSDKVPLGAYLSRVCAATQGLSEPGRILVNVDMDEVSMEADDAARVGLFLSEVLNNAIEHGFGGGQQSIPDGGRIDVRLDVSDRLVLRVADNGRGLAGAGWPRRDSLGGRIVLDLVARLRSELDVREDRGTVVTLTMPQDGDMER